MIIYDNDVASIIAAALASSDYRSKFKQIIKEIRKNERVQENTTPNQSGSNIRFPLQSDTPQSRFFTNQMSKKNNSNVNRTFGQHTTSSNLDSIQENSTNMNEPAITERNRNESVARKAL